MPFMIVVLTLFAGLMVTESEAATDAELKALAEKFSPILILAQETGRKWGNIKVLKPNKQASVSFFFKRSSALW